MDFSTELRSTRKQRGLTQQQLADELGISVMSIRRYETGVRVPKYYEAVAIMDKLKGDTEMSEKRGYPNPNYTEQDILPCLDVKSDLILDDQIIQYIQKAAMFDCLASAVKLTGEVDDDLVKAITGNLTQEEMVPKKDADDYWNYYMQEQKKTKELKEKVASLEHARMELIEILRQNKIGPFADPEPGSTLAKLLEIQKEAKEASENE